MPDEARSETVVVISGAFEGPQVDRWGVVMTEAVALQPRRLIIDLGDTPTVDAAAIAILLQAHRAMVQAGGRLVLRRPVDRVRRMLRVARVEEVFEVEGAETTERNRS